MSNKQFLTLHGAIYGAFALVLFVAPAMMWPMYGVEINDRYAHFLSQHTSIFLGGISAVSLFLRDVEQGPVARQLFKAILTTNLLGVVITVYAGVSGIFVGFGWTDPAFFAVLTVLSYRQWRRQ